jgi:hypothetical protein
MNYIQKIERENNCKISVFHTTEYMDIIELNHDKEYYRLSQLIPEQFIDREHLSNYFEDNLHLTNIEDDSEPGEYDSEFVREQIAALIDSEELTIYDIENGDLDCYIAENFEEEISNIQDNVYYNCTALKVYRSIDQDVVTNLDLIPFQICDLENSEPVDDQEYLSTGIGGMQNIQKLYVYHALTGGALHSSLLRDIDSTVYLCGEDLTLKAFTNNLRDNPEITFRGAFLGDFDPESDLEVKAIVEAKKTVYKAKKPKTPSAAKRKARKVKK